MMDYGGADLLLAGAACGRLLGHCAGLCVQALCSDLKTAWQLSFSDEMCVRGVLYYFKSGQSQTWPDFQKWPDFRFAGVRAKIQYKLTAIAQHGIDDNITSI